MPTLSLDDLHDEATVADTGSTGTALATPGQYRQLGGIEADTTAADVKLPRVNVLQKSSELADVEGWNAGDIAFAKAVKLVPVGQTGRVTFLHLKKQYQEVVPYGSDQQPKVFDTREQVFEAGGSIEFNASNEYRPIAHLTLLVEAPEGADDEQDSYFPLSFDGKSYSLAVWTVGSSAYNKVAKTLITAAGYFCREGIHTMAWSLSVEKAKSGTNTYFVPKIVQAGKHSPEFLEFVASLTPKE